MAPELIVWERDGKVHKVRVPDEGLTIGRAPSPYGASFCTTNSSVSRLHCRIARLGEGWVVEDLGSSNGTKVNGELAEGSMMVRIGDVIAFGELTAQLALEESLAAMSFEGADTHVAAQQSEEKIRTSYDTVAEKYASELADEMAARPLERGMLLAFAECVKTVPGPMLVGDVGCGPGHLSRYLGSLGVRTTGVDISAGMIQQARLRIPDGDFHVGSMFDLPAGTSSWSGAVSMYATLHCNIDERLQSFRELWRVIRPGGYLLHGFYISAPDHPSGSTYHLASWFGHQVDLDTFFVAIEDGVDELERNGFDVLAQLAREPMSATELPARRCYLLAKRR